MHWDNRNLPRDASLRGLLAQQGELIQTGCACILMHTCVCVRHDGWRRLTVLPMFSGLSDSQTCRRTCAFFRASSPSSPIDMRRAQSVGKLQSNFRSQRPSLSTLYKPLYREYFVPVNVHCSHCSAMAVSPVRPVPHPSSRHDLPRTLHASCSAPPLPEGAICIA